MLYHPSGSTFPLNQKISVNIIDNQFFEEFRPASPLIWSLDWPRGIQPNPLIWME